MRSYRAGSRSTAEQAVGVLRGATEHTPWQGRIYLVGGWLRDRILHRPASPDVDLLVDGDAVEFAKWLFARGVIDWPPVIYSRFGTALIRVRPAPRMRAVNIEMAGARAESYLAGSRKPTVAPATIEQDVLRRDFTINTLLEELHSGEIRDLTGRGLADIEAGRIRTPREPHATFLDDPLRMLRAIRFAAQLNFIIDDECWLSIQSSAASLAPPTVAWERMQDELLKIIALEPSAARAGMDLLLQSGLLPQILPEMSPMVGCIQSAWHPWDVWEHTLRAVEALPPTAGMHTRLAMLWHDIGKPATRTEDARGVHFYHHAAVGAGMVHAMMTRLKFAARDVVPVCDLVRLHMRLGDYLPEWTDASIRRLIRDCGSYLDELFIMARCDIAACSIPSDMEVDLVGLRGRIEAVNAAMNVVALESPLSGSEIMQELGLGPSEAVGRAKEYLLNQVIEGALPPDDRDAAAVMLRAWWVASGSGTESATEAAYTPGQTA
ncbi:MAG: HDIG domain-containing protein [Armatimonadetes bacterium]|nr:HDIG domain-containing protein [Armatimonadota bacterium]MDE2207477.1 HDIG domain-containing protein [Armatimonadota bacterium]